MVTAYNVSHFFGSTAGLIVLGVIIVFTLFVVFSKK